MDHSSNPQEDAEGFDWNESQWQQFLMANQAEAEHFLGLYNTPRKDHNHLDHCAMQMGWDKPGETKDEEALASSECAHKHKGPNPGFYTIHQHPIFIGSRALMIHIGKTWHNFLAKPQSCIPAVLAWNFMGSLHSVQLNGMMGLFAEDCADFTLAICHLKNALSGLNFSLKILQHIGQNTLDASAKTLCEQTQATLFDLRDLWLEAIAHCRFMQQEISTQEGEAS